ncbi:hypothetical protein CAPTEDRAFT_185509 [Capitella teleta]|uniref:PHD-type domain-containing protein n=1 Tax=Capitella teleta TaxID=283909 RepID=R7U8M3_CAPTE|nr:hypothetical protein CAPTEDRAFT_185509 [Capitella teleta]|eukprot:ELU02456.1 hypothetical protein CAPTEDRAFT_185509 [Capitella teleta]
MAETLDSGDQLTMFDSKMNPLVDSPATTSDVSEGETVSLYRPFWMLQYCAKALYANKPVWIGGAYKPSNTLGRGTDGSSCGVLVCKFAQNIIEGKPLEVPNITAARKEIVTMLLDYTDLTMLDEYCTYCCCMEDDGEGVIEWVDCVVCGRWFHATCLKSAAREMGLIRNNSEDWRCKICRFPIPMSGSNCT